MLAVNEILQQRYRIIRQLGQGGMGAVYEARDERLGSSVALKEILLESSSANSAQHALFRRAFEREAKILANLDHEAFPRVTDYFSEKERQFLVMELVYGDDLSELLAKRRSPFPAAEILRWTEQLLDALDYLHTQESPIIHRDIKPQNLKLTARGKIKLLDFGIAKGADGISSNTLTNHTFVAATQNYSPIEQIFRVLHPTVCAVIIEKHPVKADRMLSQVADARSDVYALGATLYNLATGQLPADSLKRALAVWSNEPDPLPRPLDLNSEIPLHFSDVLMKALAVDYENRFASAAEMQHALRHEAAPPAAVGTAAEIVTMQGKTLQFPSGAPTELLNHQELPTVARPSVPTVHVNRKTSSDSNSRNVAMFSVIAFLSILLISVGIAGAYYAVMNYIPRNPPPTPTVAPSLAPSLTPNASPTITPFKSVTVTPTPAVSPVVTPTRIEPTQQPTIQVKTPIPQPTRTIKKLPTAKPTLKNKDCIFNDDCE